MIFEYSNLTQAIIDEMIATRVWHDECPVSLGRLRLVKFSYYDFKYNIKDDGELVVLDAVAYDVCAIFKQLFDRKFPISKARRIEYYNGSDIHSMEDNNTSAFNFREISGGGKLSIHSYGTSIDLNPIQNPYVSFNDKSVIMLPYAQQNYLNRVNLRDGMVESIVDIFHNHGFNVWGGHWDTPIDWQHFQVNSKLSQLLVVMDPRHAVHMFNYHKAHLDQSLNFEQMINDYQLDPLQFMKRIS